MTDIDGLTLFIAALALGSTLYFSFQSYRHNRLSVKPIIDTRIEKNKLRKRLSVFLRNKGIGPAIIEKVRIKYLNCSYNDFQEFTGELRKKGEFDLKSPEVYYMINFAEEGLSVKEDLTLIDVNEFNEVDEFYELLKKVSVIVRYRDIYDKKKTEIFKLVKEWSNKKPEIPE